MEPTARATGRLRHARRRTTVPGRPIRTATEPRKR